MKILLCYVVIIWSVLELIKSMKRYRKDSERLDLITLIASIIMIPSGIILLISEIIDK